MIYVVKFYVFTSALLERVAVLRHEPEKEVYDVDMGRNPCNAIEIDIVLVCLLAVLYERMNVFEKLFLRVKVPHEWR